jgi:hypothetical protein
VGEAGLGASGVTFDELRRHFPNASKSTINANSDPDHPRPNPQLEHSPGPVPLATDQVEEANPGRVRVCIVSVRKRLLDPDNLCEKYALDCLRTIKGIRGDEPDKITLETTQRRAQKGEEEKTEITVYEINP